MGKKAHRENPEHKAFRLAYENSKEKRDRLTEEIVSWRAFQKALNQQRKKCCSCPKKDEKKYLAYLDKVEKDARAKGQKEWIYFKECHDFCNEWGVDYFLFCQGKVVAKPTARVVTYYNKDGNPAKVSIETDSVNFEGKDARALIPLFTYVKNYHLGKAPERRGDKPTPEEKEREKNFIKDYKIIKRRGDKHPLKEAAERSGISVRRGRQILKKHGIK